MPKELELGLHCREYRCLPCAGGLLDQPYRLWLYIQTALDASDQWFARQAMIEANKKPEMVPGVGFK